MKPPEVLTRDRLLGMYEVGGDRLCELTTDLVCLT